MSTAGQVAPGTLVKPRAGAGPRLACLGALLLIALVIVGVGERTTSLQALEDAVATGSVSTVQVTAGLPPGSNGFTVQRVTWRHWLLHHRTEVIHASSGDSAQGAVPLPVLHEPVTTRLRQLQPGLVIERDDQPSMSGSVLGWQVPTWTAVLALVAPLVVLVLLVAGPTP